MCTDSYKLYHKRIEIACQMLSDWYIMKNKAKDDGLRGKCYEEILG